MTTDDEIIQFEKLLEYLRYNRGFDFNGYKRPSLMRRVAKRMQTVGVKSYEEYQDYLEVHPDEFVQLFNTILINVTSFFRDPQAWEALATDALPRLLVQRGSEAQIRCWSAGCANGAEAYSLAILLAEQLGMEDFQQRVKIYATDVDEEALTYARQASYTEQEIEPVSPERRQLYFTPADNRFVFRGDLRRAVIFGRHDLLQDAPISHLDILVCRNTLMYFNAEAQGHIMLRFHYALNDDGILFLGKAEMMLTRSNLFAPVDLKHRIFTKVSRPSTRERLLAVANIGNGGNNHVLRNARLRESALSQAGAGLLLIDADGNLAFASEQARNMFGLANQDIGRPLQDLDVSYKPVELRSLIERAASSHRPVVLQDVTRSLPEAEVQYLQVRVTAYFDNNALLGAGIEFLDQTNQHQLQDELQRSRQELETTSEELQSTNEELETTNEELQSTNEELETTNEELQSTNEELETMNEELQSTNEELQTMNDEMRIRTDDLNQANFFLESILGGLHNAVVVLDDKTNILIWNTWAEELWGLYATEVKGKPFFTLDIGLPVDQLTAPVRACLLGEKDSQSIELEAVNRRGKPLRLHVAITPLISDRHERQGAILVMEEAP